MRKKALVAMAAMTALVLFLPQAASADSGRVVMVRYNTPAVGSANVGGICLGGDLNSCGPFAPGAGVTHVRIAIEDDSGLPVFASVGQDLNGDGSADRSETFCETTDTKFPDGVPVQGGSLIVFPWLLPGIDTNTFEPCVGAATSGWIVFTLHSH